MDHSEAIRLMAAEKYLLGELTNESRDQFEEHFFECQECAQDVRAGAALVEHSKVVLAGSPQPAPQVVPARQAAKQAGGWLGWLNPALAVSALAVLLAVVGYQNLVTYPKLKGEMALVNRPQLLASASLINANTRGGNKIVVSSHQGEPFLLFVDIPAETRFSSYIAELDGPTGKFQWSLTIPADAAKDTVNLRVPPGDYPAGTYTVVVRGVSASETIEVGRYPFELQVR